MKKLFIILVLLIAGVYCFADVQKLMFLNFIEDGQKYYNVIFYEDKDVNRDYYTKDEILEISGHEPLFTSKEEVYFLEKTVEDNLELKINGFSEAQIKIVVPLLLKYKHVLLVLETTYEVELYLIGKNKVFERYWEVSKD